MELCIPLELQTELLQSTHTKPDMATILLRKAQYLLKCPLANAPAFSSRVTKVRGVFEGSVGRLARQVDHHVQDSH